jgi:hypothetical protein
LVTNGSVLRLCALVAIWLGSVAPANAAIEIVGEAHATFTWNSATGDVAGYYVYVARNGAGAEFHSAVDGVNRRTIHGSFGETIRVSAAGFDGHGNVGPRSDPSEEVHFVEAAAPEPLPDTTPSPTPTPTPSAPNPPTDETPEADDPLPLPSPRLATAYDFDGDGYSDILIRNTVTGELEFWQMHGSQVAAVIPLPTMGPRWIAAGTGDFDMDGITDTLWYDPDHRTGRIRLMGDFAGNGEFDFRLRSGWVVEGAGDFDGDGRSEIATSNQSSRVEIWGLEGELVRYRRISIRQGREVAGFGDIDGDGDDDIIVQDRRKRRIEAALMSADFSVQRVLLDRQQTARWNVIDSADYDGNGHCDLLWRDLSSDGAGGAGVWYLTSRLDLSGDPLDLKLGSDHTVLGSADYDGDGSADLLVFNPLTRELALWSMGASGVLGLESLGTLTEGWFPTGFNTRDDVTTQ